MTQNKFHLSNKELLYEINNNSPFGIPPAFENDRLLVSMNQVTTDTTYK